MKTLLILRHAKSDQNQPGLADHDRPLNDRGRATAPRMGRWIRDHDLVPDLIVTSSATRTRQTARLVAEACGYDGPIVATRDLYDAEVDDYIDVVRRSAEVEDLETDPDRIMVVGHNPSVADLVHHFTGRTEDMPTAALARVDVDVAAWGDIGATTPGVLAGLWRPRDLPGPA